MKKVLGLTLATALTASVLGSVSAMAATVNSYTSNGQIGFIASTDPTDPKDPLNPTDPVDPIDPTDPTKPVTPGTNGPLSLDFASSLDFGVQKITTADETYQAASQQYAHADGSKSFGPDYAQITDNRGTFQGWTLSVAQQGDFKTTSGAVLNGAQVTLGNDNHVTASVLDGSVSNVDTATLNPDGSSVNVMSGAAASAGSTNGTSGTHLLDFGTAASLKNDQVSWKADNTTVARPSTDSDVTLAVPGTTAKMADTYTTTFLWTLGDTPTAVK
ncbi:WxL domain-containing protein [Weissella muntiaci]|uniref:WxL domain-containing protein n=1 Tax=Weissella muntiaci TaxID=2508881 RepID=A0A6C2C926_9LACO|nr:WxL domain-containing protein [Weissella muntiaci]TYC49665.1 WxL domain-containing protein [Weissella muntiaci]